MAGIKQTFGGDHLKTFLTGKRNAKLAGLNYFMLWFMLLQLHN